MIKWITKNTVELVLASMNDVDEYKKQIESDAEAGGYRLLTYSVTEKDVKVSGEVVDRYYIVKATTFFNDPKNPELPFDDVIFHLNQSLANTDESDDDFDWDKEL